MRVLIAAGIYPPESGGPATYAKAMADALPERGVAVEVVLQRDARRFRPLHHLVYAWWVLRRSKDADIIFSQHSVTVGLAALFAARIRKKHFVMRVGGDYAWEQGVQRFGVKDLLDEFVASKKRYGVRVWLFRYLQSFIARRAEAIIVPSMYLKRIVLSWGAEERNVHVVYSAFIPEEIRESKEELAMRFELPETSIVTVCRLVRWKGVRTLIELLPRLKEEFAGVGLTVIGDGPERAALKHLCLELALTERVRFLGDLPHDTTLQYLRAADLFVLNTGYEGLSYTILEAMAQGTPVVSTAVGGNPELIETGREGILVQYDNKAALFAAIRGVLSGEIDGKELARAAEVKARSFSKERMVEGTITVLKSVAEARSHPISPSAHGKKRVLMLTGDRNVLTPGTPAHARLELQRTVADVEAVYWGRGRMVRPFCTRGRFDVVTVQDPFWRGLAGWMLALLKRARFNVQVHADIAGQSALKRALARFVLGRADSIRVVSERVRAQLPRTRAKVTVLPVFVDTERFRGLVREPQEKKTLLWIGRFEREKDPLGALEVLRAVRETGTDAQLVMLGEGSMRRKLQKAAAHLPVQFPGWQDVSAFLARADVVVNTSLFESWGASIVEALAAGVPVAAPDVGIAREAGAIVVERTRLAEAVNEALRARTPGTLQLRMPTAEEWARRWEASL